MNFSKIASFSLQDKDLLYWSATLVCILCAWTLALSRDPLMSCTYASPANILSFIFANSTFQKRLNIRGSLSETIDYGKQKDFSKIKSLSLLMYDLYTIHALRTFLWKSCVIEVSILGMQTLNIIVVRIRWTRDSKNTFSKRFFVMFSLMLNHKIFPLVRANYEIYHTIMETKISIISILFNHADQIMMICLANINLGSFGQCIDDHRLRS